jgi:hypothetical protein
MLIWPMDPKTSGLPTIPKQPATWIPYAGTPWAHLIINQRPLGVATLLGSLDRSQKRRTATLIAAMSRPRMAQNCRALRSRKLLIQNDSMVVIEVLDISKDRSIATGCFLIYIGIEIRE